MRNAYKPHPKREAHQLEQCQTLNSRAPLPKKAPTRHLESIHPPAPAVGSYEWALEQKQQLVYKPPLLVTKDALASYSQWLTALDWVIASLAPKSTLPSSKMLAMRNQSAPYGYRGLDSAGQERPTYPQSYKSEAMCKRKGHGRGL
jgi:hypothetical protein